FEGADATEFEDEEQKQIASARPQTRISLASAPSNP
ncbi:hypothetical protein Tco_0930205, partial [Tanacetum coccineum]